MRAERLKRCRGFSLVEVIFAMAVLAIAILGMFGTMLASLQHRDAARQSDIASNAAREMTERIRSTPFSDIQATFGPPIDYFNVDGLELTTPNAANPNGFQGRISITQEVGDLLTIRVEITWPDGSGTRQNQIWLDMKVLDNSS